MNPQLGRRVAEIHLGHIFHLAGTPLVTDASPTGWVPATPRRRPTRPCSQCWWVRASLPSPRRTCRDAGCPA